MGRLTANEHRRRNRGIYRIASVCVASGALLFSSCQDLGVFMDEIDDQVRLANDGYLEVESTFPVQHDYNLSPRLNITVQFDKDIDPESLREKIVISQKNLQVMDAVPEIFDPADYYLEFDPVDKLLSIRPDPFLNGGEKITVTILPGATAIDGSPLRDAVTWSFQTVKMPVGVLDIADGDQVSGNDHAVTGYTNDGTPALTVIYSNADSYFITDDLTTAQNYTASDTGWRPTDGTSGEEVVDDFSFTWTGDSPGTKTLYVLFKDDNTETLSMVESDSVFFDEDATVGVYAGTDHNGYTNQTVTRTASYSAVEDTVGSGFQKAEWTSANGATFGDSSALTTTIRGPSDFFMVNMPIQVRIYDRAGNVSAVDTMTIDWDSEGPDPPDVTGSLSPSSNTPLWTWVQGASDQGSGVQDRYYYSYNNGSWYSTSANSYQIVDKFSRLPQPQPDGRYSLRIRGYDNLDNLSSMVTTYIDVNTANITPFDYHPDVPTTGLVLNWPGTTGLSITYSWALYEVGTKGNLVLVDSEVSTSASESGTLKTLKSGTNYVWGYSVYSRGNRIYTSPQYHFLTRGLIHLP